MGDCCSTEAAYSGVATDVERSDRYGRIAARKNDTRVEKYAFELAPQLQNILLVYDLYNDISLEFEDLLVEFAKKIPLLSLYWLLIKWGIILRKIILIGKTDFDEILRQNPRLNTNEILCDNINALKSNMPHVIAIEKLNQMPTINLDIIGC